MDELRRLYSTDAVARALLEYGTKQNGVNRGATVTIDTLLHVLAVEEKTLVRRRRLTSVLRVLANAGWGNLVIGRGGHPTRFVWPTALVSFRGDVTPSPKPANPDVQATSPFRPATTTDPALRPAQDNGSGLGMCSHTFRLREKLFISLTLPGDLLVREADRLARFIQALPLKDI